MGDHGPDTPNLEASTKAATIVIGRSTLYH